MTKYKQPQKIKLSNYVGRLNKLNTIQDRWTESSKELLLFKVDIFYIYVFSRRFYPKRLTVHSDYTFIISMFVPWELNPQPCALQTQCSTTEPQEHVTFDQFNASK